jgi:hypothetical protein
MTRFVACCFVVANILITTPFVALQTPLSKEGNSRQVQKRHPMKCPTCRTENLAEDIFCSECGQRLPGDEDAVTCASCGASNLPQARFCHMCAAPVENAPVADVEQAAGAEVASAPVLPTPVVAPLTPAAASVAAPSPEFFPAGGRPSAAGGRLLTLVVMGFLIVAAGLGGYVATSFLKTNAASSPTPGPTFRVTATAPAASPSSRPSPVTVPPLDNRRVAPLSGDRVSASSYRFGHGPVQARDDNPRTYWQSGEEGGTDWIAFDFKRPVWVDRVGLLPGRVDLGDAGFRANNRVRAVRIEADDRYQVQGKLSDTPKMQFIRTRPSGTTRKLRIVLIEIASGQRWHNNIIPEIEVWGHEK